METSITTFEKGKINIVDVMEKEQSYKFQADPLAEQAIKAIQEKRQ